MEDLQEVKTNEELVAETLGARPAIAPEKHLKTPLECNQVDGVLSVDDAFVSFPRECPLGF